MTIQIDVSNQKMRMASNNKELVAGTQEFIKFQFNLTSDWENLTVFAQFIQNGVAYNQFLDSNFCCYLPAEIEAGTCNMLLYGTGSRTIATSNYLTLKVIANGFVGNAESTEISMSLYQQLVNMVTGGTAAETLQSIVGRMEAMIANKADSTDVTALRSEFEDLINSTTFTQQVENKVEEKIDDMLENNELAGLVIGDATITKNKLVYGLQQSIDEAIATTDEVEGARTVTIASTNREFDTLRESLEGVYAGAQAYSVAQDTALRSDLETSISNLRGNYSGSLEDMKTYVDEEIEDVSDDLSTVAQEVETARSFTVRNTNHTYDSLQEAIEGAVEIAENYVDASLLSHESFGIKVVDALPTGADIETFTFYLIPKENGKYDKWWRINNPTIVNGVETDHWEWDNFGSTSTLVVTALPQTGDEDVDYILTTDDGCMYYKWIDGEWQLVAGSLAITVDELPEEGNPNADYYIGNEAGEYTHYRFIDGEFVVIGSGGSIQSSVASLETEVSNVKGRVTSLEGNQSTMSVSISGLSSRVQDLEDAEGDEYDISFNDETRQLTLTKNEEAQTVVTISGGGGGGTGTATSTLVVERITASPLVITPSDTANLSYTYSSTDSDGETVDGTFTWKKNGTTIATGSCVQGLNTFDVTDQCVIGSQKFTLIITDDAGSSTSKVWTVNKVDVRIESSFNDAITYPVGSPVTFTYTPYGAIAKTVHFILDGVEMAPVSSSVSGSLQSYSVPAQTHGSHLLEVFITATVNNQLIETAHIYKDIMFYDESSTVPVIGCTLKNTYMHKVASPNADYLDDYYVLDANDGFIKAPYKTVENPVATDLENYYKIVNGEYVSAASDVNIVFGRTYYTKEITTGTTYYSHKVYFNQYDTNAIQYYVNNPATSRPSVTWKVDGATVSTSVLERPADVWSYSASVTGEHTLQIICGVTIAQIDVVIVPISIDISPVTAGLAFDFNPTGLSNSSENRLWSDSTNDDVALSVSSNFDWSNGGYQSDRDGNTYFCVKAGTTATISHKLFEADPKTYGKEFKVIFKTTNVRNPETPFLSCMDGAIVSAHYNVTTDTVCDTDKTYYTESNGEYSEFDGDTFVAGTTYYEYVAAAPRNVGFKMCPHAAYLYTSASDVSNQFTYLYAPYSEEDKIEFEWNINTLDASVDGATAVVMSYEDGVGLRPMIYDASHRFVHTTSTNITIGCADCDVHIYRMKAYNNALTDSNILTNFIADAPNGAEMIARYNRNQIYDANGNLTPEALAEACPDLRIIKIECPQFTNNKSNFVKYTNVQCIYKGGDPVLDNWTFTNAYHSGRITLPTTYRDICI